MTVRELIVLLMDKPADDVVYIREDDTRNDAQEIKVTAVEAFAGWIVIR